MEALLSWQETHSALRTRSHSRTSTGVMHSRLQERRAEGHTLPAECSPPQAQERFPAAYRTLTSRRPRFTLAEQISSSGSTYTLSPTTTSNRILLTLSAGGINFMYAVYPTATNSFEMVEVDSVVPVSSGMGFLQSSTSAPSGTYGINTTGQTTTGEQDINGSISSAGTTGLTGYLDINETGTIFSNIPLSNSTIVAPASFGRATLTLATAKPTSASFTFAYYVGRQLNGSRDRDGQSGGNARRDGQAVLKSSTTPAPIPEGPLRWALGSKFHFRDPLSAWPDSPFLLL